MTMTTSKICEYYAYQAADGYGREAIDTLAVLNKCTPQDIADLLHAENLALKHYIKEDKQVNKLDYRQSAISDYNSGMTIKEVAERYQVNSKVMYNNFSRWSKKGYVELRQSTPKAEDKPVHTPLKTEKEPAMAATITSSEYIKNISDTSIVPNTKKVKQKIDFGTAVDRLALLEQLVKTIQNDYPAEVITKYASNCEGLSEIQIDNDGVVFTLQIRREE